MGSARRSPRPQPGAKGPGRAPGPMGSSSTVGWPQWRWPEQRAASWAAGWRATGSALRLSFLLSLCSSSSCLLLLFLAFSSCHHHLFLAATFSCHRLLFLAAFSSCFLLIFLFFSATFCSPLFSLLSTSEMTRGHAACCHNLYFRAGGCHFFLSSPRPAAALSIASIDVPNVGQGYAWSPLPRPPRLPPLRPRMSSPSQ